MIKKLSGIRRNQMPFRRALLLIIFLLSSCQFEKGTIIVNYRTHGNTSSNISLSRIQLINNQFILTGQSLSAVEKISVKEGSTEIPLTIESINSTTIVTNTLSNATFAAGKIFNFILEDAKGASTFTVDFSLCDSTLNSKGFDCLTPVQDKDVLSFDATTNKWMPRALNGQSYQGIFSAVSGTDPGSGSTGDYYIISASGTIGGVSYAVGDWIIYNGSSWEKFSNSTVISSVFGRTGSIIATKGDYNLNKLSDVDLTTTPPSNGDVLKYNGANWIPGTIGGGSGAPTGSAGGDLAGNYPNPTLNLSGVSAGTYKSVTVDAKGRVTAGTNPTTLSAYGITDAIVSSVTGSAPITISGSASAPIVGMTSATTSVDGYLTSSDWNTFNNKQDTLGFTPINKAGDTVSSGTFTYNGAAVLRTLDPVGLTDVATKQYVDSLAGAWTINSGNAYRSTGNVGIGTTSPSAKLDVQNTLTTSTPGLFPFVSYDLTYSPASNAASTAVTGELLNVTTSTSNNISQVIGETNIVSDTAAGVTTTHNQVYASYNSATLAGPGSFVSTYGSYNEMTNSHSGSVGGSYAVAGINTSSSLATVSNALAGYFKTSTTSASAYVSSGYGVSSSVAATNGAINNAYGLYTQITKTSGTVTNAYGIYIGNLAASTLKYSIYASDATASSYVAGKVGIGIIPTSYTLDVNGDANLASSSSLRIGGTQICTSTGCVSSSDQRLKENITPLSGSLEKLIQLQGVGYYYKDKNKFGKKHQIGVVAQEVEKIFPEVVITDQKSSLKSVAYDHLVAPIIEAIKSLHKHFFTLKGRLDQHDQRMNELIRENKMRGDEINELKAHICHKEPKLNFCLK